MGGRLSKGYNIYRQISLPLIQRILDELAGGKLEGYVNAALLETFQLLKHYSTFLN